LNDWHASSTLLDAHFLYDRDWSPAHCWLAHTSIKNAKDGDGQIDEIHKVKLWDKTRALEALAKHFGFVKDRIEVTGWDKLAAQLNHARTVGPTASTGRSPLLRGDKSSLDEETATCRSALPRS
jgi:hypothetical protein